MAMHATHLAHDMNPAHVADATHKRQRTSLDGRIYAASESEDERLRDPRAPPKMMRSGVLEAGSKSQPSGVRRWGNAYTVANPNERVLTNIPRCLLESVLKVDEGVSSVSRGKVKGGWSLRYNNAVNGLLAESRKSQFKPETLLTPWPKVQISQESQDRLEEYREKLPAADSASSMPLALSLLQVQRMQREMDVLTRQIRLLERSVGKEVVENTRKDAERLRDQDELSYLQGPVKIKTSNAPKEEKLRDLKAIGLKWHIDIPYDNLDHVPPELLVRLLETMGSGARKSHTTGRGNLHSYLVDKALALGNAPSPDVEYDICLGQLWPLAAKGKGAPLTFREGLQPMTSIVVRRASKQQLARARQILKYALMAAGSDLNDTAVFGYGAHNLMVGVVNQVSEKKNT